METSKLHSEFDCLIKQKESEIEVISKDQILKISAKDSEIKELQNICENQVLKITDLRQKIVSFKDSKIEELVLRYFEI